MNETTLGTCGNCGGRVVMPLVWHGVGEPPKYCKSCGATPSYGPTIPMRESQPVKRTDRS